MSGGSFDYGYTQTDEMAERLVSGNYPALWKVFGEHLKLVSKACHDIEWAYSGDYGMGDEVASIERVLGKDKVITCQLDVILERIEKLKTDLENLKKEAKQIEKREDI